MTEAKEKQQAERLILTQKIEENEQTMEELNREQRQRIAQLEESWHLLHRQGEQTAFLYQELLQGGDPKASHSMTEAQERSRQIEAVLRSQQETFTAACKKVNQQLEATNDTLRKERGKLEW